MSNSWPWFVALRYSLAGQADQLVSFMSRISIGGLTLGVAVLVLVLSVVNGFERELRERVLGVVPQGVIYSHASGQDWAALAPRIAAHPGVTAVAPITEGAGLIVVGGEPEGVTVTGIDPAQELAVSRIGDYLQAGDFSLAAGGFEVVIGSTLARRLAVQIGDPLVLVLPEVTFSLAGPVPRLKRLRVAGIFRTGSDVDKAQVYVHLADANRLFRKAQADGLRVRFADLFAASSILQDIVYAETDQPLYGVSWLRRYGNLYDAIILQKTTMFVLLSMLVGVAAFNVVSNMVLTVRDKRADIAILRSLGADPGHIRMIFMVHGVLVGFIGIAAGIVLGVAAANFASELYQRVDETWSLGLMDQYFIHYLPADVMISDLLVIALVSLMICVAAAVYPAVRAARTDPVEVLRYEV